MLRMFLHSDGMGSESGIRFCGHVSFAQEQLESTENHIITSLHQLQTFSKEDHLKTISGKDVFCIFYFCPIGPQVVGCFGAMAQMRDVLAQPWKG